MHQPTLLSKTMPSLSVTCRRFLGSASELGTVIGVDPQGIFQRVRYANAHQEELEDHEVLESIALREPGPIVHQVLSCISCIMHPTWQSLRCIWQAAKPSSVDTVYVRTTYIASRLI